MKFYYSLFLTCAGAKILCDLEDDRVVKSAVWQRST